MLHYPIQDVSLDLPDNNYKIEKDLMQDMQALTHKGDMDTQKSADTQVTNVEEPENNNKAKEEDETSEKMKHAGVAVAGERKV